MPLIAERVPGAGRVKGAATHGSKPVRNHAAAGEAFTLDSPGTRRILGKSGAVRLHPNGG
jgi:hypothetical protein